MSKSPIKLHLQPKYFDLIALGVKIGDTIEFYTDNPLNPVPHSTREIHANVISVEKFKDFTEMLSDGRLERLLPGTATIEEGVEIYRGFPE